MAVSARWQCKSTSLSPLWFQLKEAAFTERLWIRRQCKLRRLQNRKLVGTVNSYFARFPAGFQIWIFTFCSHLYNCQSGRARPAKLPPNVPHSRTFGWGARKFYESSRNKPFGHINERMRKGLGRSRQWFESNLNIMLYVAACNPFQDTRIN